jgi:hypothetical protein
MLPPNRPATIVQLAPMIFACDSVQPSKKKILITYFINNWDVRGIAATSPQS